MGELIDCEGYFTMKQTFNRIIQEGRGIIKQCDPDWRHQLAVWKAEHRQTLDSFNFKKGPPYDK